MAIYQIKIKGSDGILSYDTYRAANAEDAIRQFLESEERSKKSSRERYQPKEIREVKLLLDIEDPTKALKKIDDQLYERCSDMCNLGEILALMMRNKPSLSWWEIESFITSIKEKSEQILSLLAAQYDFEENKKSYFFDKDTKRRDKTNN